MLPRDMPKELYVYLVRRGYNETYVLRWERVIDYDAYDVTLKDGNHLRVPGTELEFLTKEPHLIALGKAYYSVPSKSPEEADARGWNKALKAIWEAYMKEVEK